MLTKEVSRRVTRCPREIDANGDNHGEVPAHDGEVQYVHVGSMIFKDVATKKGTNNGPF